MERKRLWRPEWAGSSFEKWAAKMAHNNVWRTLPLHDVEDLMQDAYLYFMLVKERYNPGNARHFMSLFMRCFYNHIQNLARDRMRQNETHLVIETADGEIDYLQELCEDQTALVALHVKLAVMDAPTEVQSVLNALTDPEYSYKPKKRRRGRGRETPNQFLCRIAGLNARKIDVVGQIKEWLGCEVPA